MQLTDTTLLRQQAYIDGAWRHADDGATLDVSNPATGDRIGSVPKMGRDETARAIAAAAAAWPAWRKKSAKERAAILRKWNDLILENAADLALLMTTEQGKPLDEAKGEVVYGASFIEWFAEEGKRVAGETLASPWPDRRLVVTREPIGVCAAITPWNFPIAMITRKVGPALAAGCTMVLKPAESTPPTSMPPSTARSRRSTATPARPASAPTASMCRTASTTVSRKSWWRRWPGSRSATASSKASRKAR